MKQVDNPCVKECPDRTATCHGTCERYARYAAWCEEQREARAKRQANKAPGVGLKRALNRKQRRERQGRK